MMNRRWVLLLAFNFLVSVLGISQIVSQSDAPPIYALPDADLPVLTSSSMQLSADGGLLVTANMLSDTVSLIDVRNVERTAEITVGHDPRSVAFSRDQTQLLVTNRLENSLSVVDIQTRTEIRRFEVGAMPYGVVAGVGNLAYISLMGSGEIAVVDTRFGEVLSRISTPDFPAGLALWGDFLYVTHFWSGELSLIYLPQQMVVRTIQTDINAALAQSIEIDPENGLAYVPISRSFVQNPTPTFDTMIFPEVAVVDLQTFSALPRERIALDIVDRPVNQPFAIALDRDRNRLFVANAGSNDLSIINRSDMSLAGHIKVDAGPRALRLGRQGERLYVHNVIDGTISVIGRNNLRKQQLIVATDLKILLDVVLGAQLFYSADNPAMSRSGWISCANCHFDGMSDGRVWLVNGDRLNTPVLYGLPDSAPYNWHATWDDLGDLELKIRTMQFGTGLVHAEGGLSAADSYIGQSPTLDLLVNYLLHIEAPTMPSATNTEQIGQIERGADVFAEQGCGSCHAGVLGLDGLQHDVGTGGEIDTPTLNWLWQSAPYLHNGRASTLEELFIMAGEHQLIENVAPDDLNALIAFLGSRSR